MIRSFYSTVSGLITLQNEQETITNNLANIQNNGFKKSQLTKQSFEDVLISNRQKVSGNDYARNNIGDLNLGVKVNTVKTLHTQGPFKTTESASDFGIDGRGFFVIRDGNQQMYTRDGNFKVNNAGYLVTNDGYEVLGRNNQTGQIEPIYIGDHKFTLDGDNGLRMEDIGTAPDTLLTADFESYDNLKVVGNNFVTSDNPLYDANVTVRQYVLEKSNVNPTEEFVKLLEVKRQFETNQKFIRMQDETVDKACNQIGRV